MHLAEELSQRLSNEESVFRAQLLREDMARFEKLRSMAQDQPSFEAFEKDGLYIGWTQGDMRTHELRDTILPLLAAYHAYETGGRTDVLDQTLRQAWNAFDKDRMAKLLGCL